MDLHAAKVLDFGRVLSLLAGETATPMGGQRVLDITKESSYERGLELLDELDAFTLLVASLGEPPLSGFVDIEDALGRSATQGACLDIESLLDVSSTVSGCARLIEYLEDAALEGSPIGAYIKGHTPLYPLEELFLRTFGPRGEVLDTASPELKAIRDELKELRGKVMRVLKRILGNTEYEHVVQEDFITLRSNRYVVPLKTDFRGYLSGIVHDHSNTGQTVFVEPMEVVEINNRVGEAKEEESAEVRRILMALTAKLGGYTNTIKAQINVAAQIDLLSAKLKLAKRVRGVRPELVREPVLEIKDARHPFLDIRENLEVVPISILFEEDTKLLLVTGANAGGKTVALKTAGLLTMMAHAGFFIPAAEGSVVGWFPEVLADIGDEQDIERDLSTFSAHMARMKEIFDLTCEGTLVLLDELGTGTDPAQGVALSVAILEELKTVGARVLATTHLDGLKSYAYSSGEAKNAAVSFDPKTGTPRYKLLYGQAGSSNAIEVARKMGLPEGVLLRAASLTGEEGDGTAVILRDLERARDESRQAREESERLNEKLRQALKKRQDELEEARAERRKARAEARREAMSMVREMRKGFKSAIDSFKESKLSRQETQKRIEELAGRVKERFPKPPQPEGKTLDLSAVKVGAKVRVASLGKDGVVESEPSGGKVRVLAGGIKLTVPLSELSKPGGTNEGPKKKRRAPIASVRVDAERGSPDIVLIGRSVDEALTELERAVDKAIVSGIYKFRVVHGRGTGALREAVRETIARTSNLKRVEDESGDDAVTWIEVI